MKKALLLVLVLAFALVPVFSSVAAAEAPKAADFTIGAGYPSGPAKLADTDKGLQYTQDKGYFYPAGLGKDDFAAWGDGLGVVAKNAWDPADLEEISVTLSLDKYCEFRYLDLDKNGKFDKGVDTVLGDPDNWFKFTLMNQAKTLMFDYFSPVIDKETRDPLEGQKYSGLTVSFQQVYENWGNAYGRLRIWMQQITSADKWEVLEGDTEGTMVGYEAGGGQFAGVAGTVDGVFEFDPIENPDGFLGQPVTVKFIKKNNGKYQATAKIGDDEQIIGIGLDLVGLWGGETVETVYAGFESAMDSARIPVIGEDGAQETWPDGGGKWMDQIEGTAEADKYLFFPVVATISDLYGGEVRAEEEEPAETEAPSETAAPSETETPDIPQAGQDFSLAIILGSMAGMLALAGAAVLVNKSRKNA